MADSLGSETNESETGGRQALLYCKASNGRAAGMPVVIFLPESEKMSDWKLCIRRTISETELYAFDEVILNKIYFMNKNSRCLSLIAITGDSGIEQVNLEYPSRQKNGRLSTSRIKLACDWHQKGESLQKTLPSDNCCKYITVDSIFFSGKACNTIAFITTVTCF